MNLATHLEFLEDSMKTILCLLIVILILTACNKPIAIIKFRTSDSIITEGNKTYLEWEVQNADSIVLKQQSFDEPILESAPLRSRMLVSPSFTTEYSIYAYKKDKDKREKCELTVVKKATKVDTVVIIKPTVMQEPSTVKSDYVRGLQTIENTKEDTKIKYDIFFVDKLDYPTKIQLYVTVKDEFGNFIANLAPPYGSNETAKKYFVNLMEEVDGKDYKIDDFDVEERHDTLAAKYSFSLVLDHSGSMDNVIVSLQNSVKKFISKMEKKDEASIIKFDQNIERTVNLTNDKNALLTPSIFDGLNNFGGGTALIAAADEGIRSLSGNKTTKIEVLFTDGYENSSMSAALQNDQGYAFLPKQLIYNARDEKVRIFTIGYGNVDKTLLEKISALTDGKSYFANNSQEIEQIFNELPRIFHNYYLVTFKPKKLDGEHNIIMTLGNPDGTTGNINRKTYIGKIDGTGLDLMQRQWIAYFEYSKDELQDIYKPNIETMANYLIKNPKTVIEIHGHTDLTGAPTVNMDLSKRRAEIVAKEFEKLGIPKSRIIIVPHGMADPIWNPETNDYEKKENRRVEFVIKV